MSHIFFWSESVKVRGFHEIFMNFAVAPCLSIGHIYDRFNSVFIYNSPQKSFILARNKIGNWNKYIYLHKKIKMQLHNLHGNYFTKKNWMSGAQCATNIKKIHE